MKQEKTKPGHLRFDSNYYKFAESPIWLLQRRYFEKAGISAWKNDEVPHYITSNPHIARAYAQLLLAFLRDRKIQQEPLYIIELGTGPGRFTYHLLKEMSRLMDLKRFEPAPFIYVMTDFVPETLQYWRDHPRLQDFFERGMLDYALFDGEHSTSIHLQKSNLTLEENSLEHPFVVLANYFFDSIPQDLFYLNDGTAGNVMAELQGYDQEANDVAGHINDIKLNLTVEPLAGNPYDSEVNNEIFNYYRLNVSDSYLLFPHIGIRCIERLKKLSMQGMLLITADKALYRLSDWQNMPAPYIAEHGSFSLITNYHAIKTHCDLSGGKSLFPRHETIKVAVGALLYVNNPEDYLETLCAYNSFLADYGPDDYFTIKKNIEQRLGDLSINELFSFLRFSGYDAVMFYRFVPRFHELLDSFTENNRLSFVQITARIWEGYYPIAENDDLAFEIGLILYDLSFPTEALSFFQISKAIYGTNETVLYAIANCLLKTGNVNEAVQLLNELLERSPEHELVNKLLNELTASTLGE